MDVFSYTSTLQAHKADGSYDWVASGGRDGWLDGDLVLLAVEVMGEGQVVEKRRERGREGVSVVDRYIVKKREKK